MRSGAWEAVDAWDDHAYRLVGDEAVGHLFRVPAGLDSAIVGEGQVMAQFKAAHGAAQAAGSLDARLDFLMRHAITTAKRVRTETGVGRSPVGFGQAAVVQARASLGGLRGRSALLIGAGKIAGSAARSFASAGMSPLYFSSRTQGRASALAGDMRGSAAAVSVSHAELERVAAEVDLIVTSTSSDGHLIGREMAEDLMRRRGGRPLVIIDLAVPRDVAPEVGALDRVRLFNIDDLAETVNAGRLRRAAELPLAEAIVADEVERAQLEISRRRADPAVVELSRGLDERRRRLLAARAPDPDLERAARALGGRLLHTSIEYLREAGDSTAAVEAALALLGLDAGQEPT